MNACRFQNPLVYSRIWHYEIYVRWYHDILGHEESYNNKWTTVQREEKNVRIWQTHQEYRIFRSGFTSLGDVRSATLKVSSFEFWSWSSKSPSGRWNKENSSQQPDACNVFYISWCQNSSIRTIHAQPIHSKSMPRGRSDSKARNLEKGSTSGNVQISCVMK